MKVRYVQLDDTIRYADWQQYAPLLPAERQEKLRRLRFEADRLRSLAAGLLIRFVTGGAPLSYGVHDKPYAADSGWFFNISHSGAIVAIAFDSAEVGVDAEVIPAADRLKIADRYFHPAERDYVYTAADPCRAFCEIWTRKEAVLKCTGEGITTDLSAFDVTASPWKERLATVYPDGVCLSVCSADPIVGAIDISEIELKSLI